MRRPLIYLTTLLLAFSTASGTILNTKHNLSATGPGTIKASSEQEVCVFCHIPHNAQPGKPLWNREMPQSAYIMYDSEYLKRTNYPLPADLGITEGTPGSLSRQCLSCHDGTVAIGAVYMVRGSILGNTLIDMIGVNADGTMPSTAEGFIGTDLSIHHPVGIEYDPTNVKNFGVGSKTIELKTTPDAPLKLYTYSGKQYVECTSCHDPHLENMKFLRVNTGANHGENVKFTCMSCHDKNPNVPWPTTHEVMGSPYWDQGVKDRYNNGGSVSVADLYCVNCHTPHNGQGKPYLLRQVEQNTCYMGAAASKDTAPCHGTGTTWSGNDIESILNRPFAHPVNTIDGVHTNFDTLYGYGSTETDPASSHSVKWSDSKHAECMDCHNQHRLGSNNHIGSQQDSATKWYPDTPSNAVSDVIRKVQGVEPSWPAMWTQPTSFTTLAESTKEYQICLKCHSYWALGPTLASAAGEVATGATDNWIDSESVRATDQAFEFNPNNRSAHPVIMALNDMPGSYAPKGLDTWGTTDVMFYPWNQSLGTQTMYCSDCHGADNEDSGDPKGPHGSSYNFMLKGPNKYWPEDPNGNLFSTGQIQADGTIPDLFCSNCHNLNYPHKQWAWKMERYDIACVRCHVAIPHGSPVSRLIGYANFPEPYNYNYNGTKQLLIYGYKKASPTSLDISSNNVYAPGCGGGGCHGWNAGGYDIVDPMP
ncbi:cytochrome c3 family protein [Nitrosophilus alvini]|uniref:cytochrome c3 family protein n=1 Tax=Nitrosophilus alvini TaxID=2714855 RepID=UPI00190C7C73|nr:cytochrome c3 family protein [Nitrosophilus alvini]